MVSMEDVRLLQLVSSGDRLLDRRFERARESFATGDATAVSDRLGIVVQSAPRIRAADVFIYFHDLLGDTLRYAHGEAHVRHAPDQGGSDLALLESAPARNDKGMLVPGLVVVARAPS
jgi:hypothetical protein